MTFQSASRPRERSLGGVCGPTLVAADLSGPHKREKESPTKRNHMNKLTKWNPLKLSPSWDPFREMEEIQNRLSSLFSLRLPAWRTGCFSSYWLMAARFWHRWALSAKRLGIAMRPSKRIKDCQ